MPLPERSAPRGPGSRPVSERRAVAVSRRSGANAKNPVRAPSRDVRTIVISDRKSPRWSYHCDFSSNSSSCLSSRAHDIILPGILAPVMMMSCAFFANSKTDFSRRTGHFSKIRQDEVLEQVPQCPHDHSASPQTLCARPRELSSCEIEVNCYSP